MKAARFACLAIALLSPNVFVNLAGAQSFPRAPRYSENADHKLQAITQQGQSGPQLRFQKPVTYNSGSDYLSSVVVADVNGDGKLDILAGTSGTTVNVLLGNGDGTLQASHGYSVGAQSTSVAVADVNGDGYPDIIAATNPSGNGAVAVLLNNGDGTFQSAVSYSSGGPGAVKVLVADVNGDGHPDLIAANFGVVGVLLNNGNGTFKAPVTYDVGSGQVEIAVADVNGDGVPDLAESTGGYTIGIMFGNGDGSLQAPVNYSPGGFPRAIAFGDVNGDGKLDLIVAAICANGCPNAAVEFYAGNGDGTFQPFLLSSTTADNFVSISIADLDGSGKKDLVIGKWGSSRAEIFLGNGDGSFNDWGWIDSRERYTNQVAVADLDGDGRPDLIMANACGKNGCELPDANLDVVLNKSVNASTTTLTSSANPAYVGQPVTFTATITSVVAVPDGETVTFYNHKIAIGTGTTTNGAASWTTSFAAAKTYTVKATYAGGGFLATSSGAMKEVVHH